MTSTVERSIPNGASLNTDGTTQAPAYAWKCAYGALAAMAVTIPLGVGFFLYEGIFALLSDAGALLVGLFLAPLVWSLYRLNGGASLNSEVFGVGVVTVAGICLGSLGLVVVNGLSLNPAISGAPFLGIQFLGWILLGIWLLGIGVVGRRSGAISERTSRTGIAAGIGIVGVMVTLIYSYAVGSFTLLFPLFAVIFGIGFLLFLFWIGGELRQRERAY